MLRSIDALKAWPPVVSTPWLWALVVAVVLATGYADSRVYWDGPPVKGDEARIAGLVGVSIVVSAAFKAGLPGWRSALWPVGGWLLAMLGVLVRVRAQDKLGKRPDGNRRFNGGLTVVAGEEVITTGPYRVVRHPGYLGVFCLQVGLMVMFAYWPPVLVMLVAVFLSLRRRIATEEEINAREMVGYREYMERVRWRLIPWVW